MNGPFLIPPAVALLLKEAMLEPRELEAALTAAEPEARTSDGLRLRLRPRLAVSRPLDPEFAEIRELLVVLLKGEHGWVVESVTGLPDPETGA